MKKRTRNLLLLLLAVLVVIQFFPIDQTNPPSEPSSDFIAVENPPPAVAKMLKNACYDCHSHHTEYPWYCDYQPVGWVVRSHFRGARNELNFSKWKEYSAEDKAHAFGEMAEEVGEGGMPMKSYVWMHPEAKLTEGQRAELVAWFRERGE